METNRLRIRDPFSVLLYSMLTLGVYLMFWYSWIYDDLEELAGETPTGNSFIADFFLNILTCGIYGIYVDYRISLLLHRVWKEQGVPNPDDDSWLIMLLDVLSFFNCYITSFYSSSLQQGKLNKILEHMHGAGNAPGNDFSPPAPADGDSGPAWKPGSGKDENPYG